MSTTRLADALHARYSPLYSPRAVRDDAIARYERRQDWPNALGWMDDQYQRLFMFAAEESRRAQEVVDRARVADFEFLLGQGSMPFVGHCVYSLFDSSDALLYVGQTANVWKRVGAHSTKPWGDRIASVRVIRCESRQAALELEARLIGELDPPKNIMLRPWRMAASQ